MKKLVLCFLFLYLNADATPHSLVEEFTLKNGLKVLFLEEHKAPIATFQVWYRVGSMDEPVGKTGLSHMMEHMMFKGTKKVGPKEFSRIVQRNGGIDNAYTTQNTTAFYQNFAADRLELSLQLESDRMQNLVLAEKEFSSERQVIKEERRMRYEDNPVHAVVEEMRAAAFKAHPYHWPVIGWMDDIDRISLQDIKDWYLSHYVPNNAFLVVAGDIQPKIFIKKIKKYFEAIPTRPVTAPYVIKEPTQKGERKIYLKKEAKLPFVFVGYHTPRHVHPDSFVLEVLATILSGGKSSRLYQTLVHTRQLAAFAEGAYERIARDPNMFYVYAEVLPGIATDKVEQALYEEIEKLKTAAVASEELQKAKNQLESDCIQSQDSIFSQAAILGSYEACSSWKDWEKYLPGIQAVTAAEVQRVAQLYLTEDNRTVGILIPQAGREGIKQ